MQTEPINQFGSAPSSLRTNKGSLDCNEEDLVVEAKGGSLSAFEQLVAGYQTKVFRLAQRLAPSYEDAEEIKQNAFVKAFKNLAHFRGDSRFYTWLVRITINEGLMMVRRRHWNEISIDDLVEREEGILRRQVEHRGPTPEECYSQRELQSILLTAMAQLSPGYRAVIQLRDIEGWSTEETAHALDLSPSAVKTRLQRARSRLRESLQQYFKWMSVPGTLRRRSAYADPRGTPNVRPLQRAVQLR